MFGKRFKGTSIVEFQCSPRPEGTACCMFGMLFLVMLVSHDVVYGIKSLFASVLLYVASAGLLANGVWLWRFRRRPLTRTVRLGGLSHALFLRGRVVFVAFETAYTLAAYVIAFCVVTLLFDGPDGFADALADRLRRWAGLLIFMLYHIVVDYLSYHCYLRSPESSHKRII